MTGLVKFVDEMFRPLDNAKDIMLSSPKGYNRIVFETVTQPEKYILRAEVPGYNEKDISISVRVNTLTIAGKIEKINQSENIFQSSISNFEQSFVLPQEIKADDISAELKNGILAITLPRTKDSQRIQRQIQIKT